MAAATTRQWTSIRIGASCPWKRKQTRLLNALHWMAGRLRWRRRLRKGGKSGFNRSTTTNMEMDSKKDPSSSDSNNNGSLDPIPPVSIPDHQLLRRIARGSYGEVWMARSSMGMLRAIKIVHRKTFQDQRPFERELSGIRRFEPISRSHEGFVDVLHAGINEPEGYFYYI